MGTSVQSRVAALGAVGWSMAAEAEAAAAANSMLTHVLTVTPAHAPVTSHQPPCSPTTQDRLFPCALLTPPAATVHSPVSRPTPLNPLHPFLSADRSPKPTPSPACRLNPPKAEVNRA